MRDSPTRTLCLTDVVDSTQLAMTLGDERNGALWDAHDALARALVGAWRGTELERTDGIMVLFEAPADAVGFAVAYHAAVRTLDPPLLARAGIHTAPLAIRPNPPGHIARGAKRIEVDGLGIAITARVMSVAVGGQTLVSFAPETTLRTVSHGHWHLKGVPEPVELFEVGDETAPFTPPDAQKAYRVVRAGELWLPVRQVPHTLPRQRDAFVGRVADLQDLAGRLDAGAALISVLGMGGTGKTRFVVQYGWTWLGEWPGGVWFCDVSEARSVDGIVSAVARALDVPLGKDDPVVQLGYAIAGRGRCLVVLDNFEQVARHAPDTLGRWLDQAREAAFVVTTREVLGMPGEQSVALAPLPVADGVALFVARARAARSDFALGDAERTAVEALVKLLDGLPLAIELAAARVRVMAPPLLLQRMSDRFKLLSSSGGRHTRQATLRATLDWSWDLLSADEQAALSQLSVFEGGFTLEAAEAVLVLAEVWPIDAVQGLVDKSLVRRVGDARYDLLVSVQEYAAERLAGTRTAAETRHGAWFGTFGTEEALTALDRPGGVQRLHALAVELDNLVAAIRRAVARGDGEVAGLAVQAAWAILRGKGPLALGVALATEVVALPVLPRRAEVLGVLASALRLVGRGSAARTPLEASLAVARAAGNPRFEARLLGQLASLHREQGRMDEARATCDTALAVVRASGQRDLEGTLLAEMGVLHREQGRRQEARTCLEAALAVHREFGDRRGEGAVLGSLAVLHNVEGREEEAHQLQEASLAVFREVGDLRNVGTVLNSVALLHWNQGRPVEAHATYLAALRVHREVGSRRSEGIVLGNLGHFLMDHGQWSEGHQHATVALEIHREVGNRYFEGLVLGYLGEHSLNAGAWDEARAWFEASLAAHRAVGNTRAVPWSMLNLSQVHHRRGAVAEARACMEVAESLMRASSDPVGLVHLLCTRATQEHELLGATAAWALLAEAEAVAAPFLSPRRREGLRSALNDLATTLATAREALTLPVARS
jgi:predicted ATPase/Tfp pilus assembly protein PilF